jgi:hypothetical protein
MGKSKNKTQTSTTQQNQLPAYMRQGSQLAVQTASNRLNTAYEGYGGQRIADLSQNEQMGIDMARSNLGAGDEDYQSARDALGRVGSFTDEGVAERYMNPYMEQVLAPQRRRQNEAFEASRAERQRTAGMQTAFGGRQKMWDQKFEDDFQQRQDELTGTAYGAAFDRAAGLHGREQDRNIQQAGAYTDLAGSQSTAQRQQLRDLMSTGLTERTRDQADLDFQYLEHLEERDWDVSNLSTLVQTLASVPSESTIKSDSTQTTTSKPSPLKTIAGIGAITAGAIMTGGSSLGWGAVGQQLMGAGTSAVGGES